MNNSITGRGGARRRELEEQSGANIYIEEADGEGVVKIRGSEDVRSRAKELVEEIIRYLYHICLSREYMYYGNSLFC